MAYGRVRSGSRGKQRMSTQAIASIFIQEETILFQMSPPCCSMSTGVSFQLRTCLNGHSAFFRVQSSSFQVVRQVKTPWWYCFWSLFWILSFWRATRTWIFNLAAMHQNLLECFGTSTFGMAQKKTVILWLLGKLVEHKTYLWCLHSDLWYSQKNLIGYYLFFIHHWSFYWMFLHFKYQVILMSKTIQTILSR